MVRLLVVGPSVDGVRCGCVLVPGVGPSRMPGVAGVGVAPTQVFWSRLARTVCMGWFELAMTKVRSVSNCGSMGLAQEALVRGRHISTLLSATHSRIFGVMLADRWSTIT